MEQGTPRNPSPVTAELKSDASLCMHRWSHGGGAPGVYVPVLTVPGTSDLLLLFTAFP